MLTISVMIGLIPLVRSDFILSAVYLCIAAGTLFISKDVKKEILFFVFGFVLLAIAEIFFVATGVEVFQRDVLIAHIPIWLPILWGYSFIMIRRSIVALDAYLG